MDVFTEHNNDFTTSEDSHVEQVAAEPNDAPLASNLMESGMVDTQVDIEPLKQVSTVTTENVDKIDDNDESELEEKQKDTYGDENGDSSVVSDAKIEDEGVIHEQERETETQPASLRTSEPSMESQTERSCEGYVVIDKTSTNEDASAEVTSLNVDNDYDNESQRNAVEVEYNLDAVQKPESEELVEASDPTTPDETKELITDGDTFISDIEKGAVVNLEEDQIEDTTTKEESHEKEPTDEWLDVLGNGLLKKKILVQGKGRDTRPVNGQEVTLNIKGSLPDGTCIDSHDEFTFMLGDEDVIVAWELAVALMEIGEKALVKTHSKYAYAQYGRPDFTPPIPPNADIEYEIEMLSVKDGPDLATLSDDMRIDVGDKKRMKGNYLYGLGDYNGAITMYKRGIKYLEGSSSKDVAALHIKCWNNLCAAQLKVQAYKAALQSCDTVLRAEPDNMKAYFRKGKCLDGLGEIEEALKCFKKASMLDPENKMILQELGRLKSRVVKSQKKEREMYQRMIQGSDKGTDGGEGETKGSWWTYIVGAVAVAAGSVVIGLLWSRQH